MSLTYVRIRVAKDRASEGKPVRVLVDTGATYTMLPSRTIEALGIVPEARVILRLGDGRLMERDIGTAFVRYRKYASPTWVMFGERGNASVLGALTLEELRLQVDPRTRRLREIKVAWLVSGTPERGERLSARAMREVAKARRQVAEGRTASLEELAARS